MQFVILDSVNMLVGDVSSQDESTGWPQTFVALPTPTASQSTQFMLPPYTPLIFSNVHGRI